MIHTYRNCSSNMSFAKISFLPEGSCNPYKVVEAGWIDLFDLKAQKRDN